MAAEITKSVDAGRLAVNKKNRILLETLLTFGNERIYNTKPHVRTLGLELG
jgi:hypothetical protein